MILFDQESARQKENSPLDPDTKNKGASVDSKRANSSLPGAGENQNEGEIDFETLLQDYFTNNNSDNYFKEE